MRPPTWRRRRPTRWRSRGGVGAGDAAGGVAARAARDAGCEVDVAHVPDEPPTAVEPATVELVLTVLLLAGLAQARRGEVLRVDRPATVAGRDATGAPVLRIARLAADAPAPSDDGAPRWDAAGVTLAAALLAAAGGRLTTGTAGLSRAADAAALDDAPALHLVLPDLTGDDGGLA